jgi:dTDP-4-amino-4,6-dideoxygalactose transaminase
MKVPLLDLKAQYKPLRQEIRGAIDRVCDSQHFILGPEVAALEAEIAAVCGSRFAIGVSSGTDALLTSLMASGVGPEDEVITSCYSFFATAGVITRLGARPVFVDIDDQFNLVGAQVRQAFTPRTRAIIPVHLFGRCADTDDYLVAARERAISVIEDAAQAIGARDEAGGSAGSIGDLGCFSFFPSKNLGAFGDGGMVVTDSAELAERVRVLRVHGGKPKYYHAHVGGNFRLDALQAAVLRVKLRYLPLWTEARRRHAQFYRTEFARLDLLEQIHLPTHIPGHIYNQFVIRCSARDHLQSFLRQRGVETEVYYPVPLHLQACFADLGYAPGAFPLAERAAHEALALPIYPELSAEQQTYVAEQVAEFCRLARLSALKISPSFVTTHAGI